jgi:hypothetical protein
LRILQALLIGVQGCCRFLIDLALKPGGVEQGLGSGCLLIGRFGEGVTLGAGLLDFVVLPPDSKRRQNGGVYPDRDQLQNR